jgi:preprotein translocase SecE subunit
MEETPGSTDLAVQQTWLQQHTGSIVLWSIILAILAILLVTKWGPIAKFIRETRVELGKCSWPWDLSLPPSKRYQELISSTLIVLIGMILLGAYTSLFDYLLGSGVRWLMSP